MYNNVLLYYSESTILGPKIGLFLLAFKCNIVLCNSNTRAVRRPINLNIIFAQLQNIQICKIEIVVDRTWFGIQHRIIKSWFNKWFVCFSLWPKECQYKEDSWRKELWWLCQKSTAMFLYWQKQSSWHSVIWPTQNNNQWIFVLWQRTFSIIRIYYMAIPLKI